MLGSLQRGSVLGELDFQVAMALNGFGAGRGTLVESAELGLGLDRHDIE